MSRPDTFPWKEFHRTIRANIATHGRHLIGVFPTKDSLDSDEFTYTIGNKFANIPDLIVDSIHPSIATLCNMVSDILILQKPPIVNGMIVSIGGQFGLKLAEVGEFCRDRIMVQAGQFYGNDNYKAMQIILPDKSGRYPGDEGCEPPYSLQTIY